jgi:tetratricopeptide (TPR) repeat protein
MEKGTVYCNRGLAHYRKNETDEALDDFSRAIELDPKTALAYNNRAAIYRVRKDYDRAIEADPESRQPYAN